MAEQPHISGDDYMQTGVTTNEAPDRNAHNVR